MNRILLSTQSQHIYLSFKSKTYFSEGKIYFEIIEL